MLRVLPLALAVLVAGCVAPAAEEPSPSQSTDAAPEAGSFTLLATGCLEGGAHSVHPEFEGYLPDPWEPADVLDDTGTPPLTTEFWAHPLGATPEKGKTMGNWHVTVACKSWTLDGESRDILFGYVGMRVEPPPFDDAANPAERHYLVTVIGSSDADLNKLLHDAGFHATPSKGKIGPGGPMGMESVLDTEDHGIYESMWKRKEVGPMTAGLTRLWWQLEREDGGYRPIALDLLTTKAGKHLQADGYGWFSHMGTADHAFIDSPMAIPPGAGGESPALAFADFDRTITLGPRPDVKLAEAYIHQ